MTWSAATSTSTAALPARRDAALGLEPEGTGCAARGRDQGHTNHLEETYAAVTTCQRRLQAKALDFDDLSRCSPSHLFQQFPEVRETYRRRFRHMLVDGTRTPTTRSTPSSTSSAPARWRSRPRRGWPDAERVEPAELMVVGDADQSIYAFHKGQHPQLPRLPRRDFPDASSLLLEQNYRSARRSSLAANAVISHNKGHRRSGCGPTPVTVSGSSGYVADDGDDRPVRLRGESTGSPTQAGTARRRRGVLPHQRPVARVRGSSSPPRHALQGHRRGAVLRASPNPRRAGLLLRMLISPADQVSLRRILNTPGRASGTMRSPASPRWPTARRITFWEALRRAETPGSRHPLAHADPGLHWRWSGCSRWSTGGERPTSSSRPPWPARATSPRWRATTRRTRRGWRTSPGSSPSPASSPRPAGPDRRPTRRRQAGTVATGARRLPRAVALVMRRRPDSR